jgi:hypothetical protein
MLYDQEPTQENVEVARSTWPADIPLEQPMVTFEIEHETLVKARTRNRNAQRKHRQSTSPRPPYGLSKLF